MSPLHRDAPIAPIVRVTWGEYRSVRRRNQGFAREAVRSSEGKDVMKATMKTARGPLGIRAYCASVRLRVTVLSSFPYYVSA